MSGTPTCQDPETVTYTLTYSKQLRPVIEIKSKTFTLFYFKKTGKWCEAFTGKPAHTQISAELQSQLKILKKTKGK